MVRATLRITFNLSLKGHITVVGNLSASIQVSQNWINSGGTWTIQKETWNYITFTTTNPGTATVFPQWGLSLEGKSPDLASEHVLEWDAAPYVAAGIYGSIITIFGTSIDGENTQTEKIAKRFTILGFINGILAVIFTLPILIRVFVSRLLPELLGARFYGDRLARDMVTFRVGNLHDRGCRRDDRLGVNVLPWWEIAEQDRGEWTPSNDSSHFI